MKTTSRLSFVACLIALHAQAQSINGAASVSAAGERGANHQVWQRVTTETAANGEAVLRTNSYTALVTGLHYWEDNQWKETREVIEAYPDGAIARQGQHKVIFAQNLNTDVAIDLQTPDGGRFQSRVLGLSYFDTATGNSVLIAEIKDSYGQIVEANQVIYPDAVTDLAADIRYTYTKAGFEQDIILRERPPGPEEYGLNPNTTRLQVMTEFVSAPRPVAHNVLAGKGANAMEDQSLNFGSMLMGRGKAFALGETAHPLQQIAVGKQWTVLEGRTILFEEVSFNTASEELQKLPAAQPLVRKNILGSSRHVVSSKRLLPSPRLAQAKKGEMRLAKLERTGPAFVVDYAFTIATTNDYVFRGDTTYCVSNYVLLTGTTIIEGGAVFKHTIKYSDSPTIEFDGPVICKTGPYRPAIFTSQNDNSVGVTINGSTGVPTSTSFCLLPVGGLSVSNAWQFKYLRMMYGAMGIAVLDTNDLIVSHCQFVTNLYNDVATPNSDLIVRNSLFTGCAEPFYAGYDASAENVTADGFTTLCTGSGTSLHLTNCLLTGSTTLTGGGTPTPVRVCTTNLASASGVFRSFGGGGYYLTNGSSLRNAGTTNINAALLAELAKRTTYPPLFCSNVITTDTTWSAQAQRDADAPDLGYHYDPLDYIADAVIITNATLTIGAGTAIASYTNTACIWMQDNTAIYSVGTPNSPNWMVSSQCVQERPKPLNPSLLRIHSYHYGSIGQNGLYRFTHFSTPSEGGSHLYHNSQWAYASLTVQDCEFWGGKNDFKGAAGSDVSSVLLRNNVFYRSTVAAFQSGGSSSAAFAASNNLVVGVSVWWRQPAGATWQAHDNMFDDCSFTFASPFSLITNSHNAYLNCTGTGKFTNSMGNDLIHSNFTYTAGPLGDFYHSTISMVNTGSVTDASSVGLYHYCTSTNLTTEANSWLDVGYHHVTTDANGLPLDYDGDGLPDYLEDVNGNGIVNSGETDWQDPADLGLRVFITRPKNNSIIP